MDFSRTIFKFTLNANFLIKYVNSQDQILWFIGWMVQLLLLWQWLLACVLQLLLNTLFYQDWKASQLSRDRDFHPIQFVRISPFKWQITYLVFIASEKREWIQWMPKWSKQIILSDIFSISHFTKKETFCFTH